MKKLTKSNLDTASTDAKDVFLWDHSLPGFGVRVKASGTKTFFIQYRNTSGRSRRLTIGRYGVLTLSKAKDLAKQKLGEVASGNDPATERSRVRHGATFKTLSDRYMRDHCRLHCKESTIKAHDWLLGKFILPALGHRGIFDISQADILKLHRSLSTTPYNANRVLGLLKAIYNKAVEWEFLAQHENPTSSVRPYRERKRERFLNKEEINKLFSTLELMHCSGEITTSVKNAISLLIMTGCRSSEVLSLRWCDIDFHNSLVRFERHKTDQKGVKVIPLNKPTMKILKGIQREPGNEFVIPGKKPGEHLVNIQKPWRRIRQLADLPDVRIHDLRHTFASMALNAGIPLAVVGGLLGHESQQSTARYAHLAAQTLSNAADIVGQEIYGELNGTH